MKIIHFTAGGIGVLLLITQHTQFNSLGVCWAFWIAWIVWCLTWNQGVSKFLCLIGFVCNAMATLSNGGVMPYIDHAGLQPYAMHTLMTTSTNLPFLCDRFWFLIGMWSIGDMFILTGFLSLLLGIDRRLNAR